MRKFDKFKENVFLNHKENHKKSKQPKPVRLPWAAMRTFVLIGAIGFGIYYYKDSLYRSFRTAQLKETAKNKVMPFNKQLVY